MMPPYTRRLIAALLLGPGLATAHVAVNVATAKADPAPVIQEDDPQWDCRINGDRVCGPTNSQGVAPGLYAAGRLVQSWPTVRTCHTLVITSCTDTYVAPALVHLGGAR